MSENVEKTNLDILIDIDVSLVKPKLRNKFLKLFLDEKINVTVNIDAYKLDENLIDIYSDTTVIDQKLKRKKKNKK